MVSSFPRLLSPPHSTRLFRKIQEALKGGGCYPEMMPFTLATMVNWRGILKSLSWLHGATKVDIQLFALYTLCFFYDTRCTRSTFQGIYLLWMITWSHCSSQQGVRLSQRQRLRGGLEWVGSGLLRCQKGHTATLHPGYLWNNPTSQLFSGRMCDVCVQILVWWCDPRNGVENHSYWSILCRVGLGFRSILPIRTLQNPKAPSLFASVFSSYYLYRLFGCLMTPQVCEHPMVICNQSCDGTQLRNASSMCLY